MTTLGSNWLDVVYRAKEATLEHAFFAFEACYAGNVVTALRSLGSKKPTNLKGYVLNADTMRTVRRFLAAGNRIQQIPANNSFTALLAGALSDPEVDTNHDGYITGKKLIAYVEQRLPQWATDYPRKSEDGSGPIESGDMVFGQVTPVGLGLEDSVAQGNAAFTSRNYIDAMRWYRKAADQGNAVAPPTRGTLTRKPAWEVSTTAARAPRALPSGRTSRLHLIRRTSFSNLSSVVRHPSGAPATIGAAIDGSMNV
jgi:hypothetical protein